VTVDKMSCIQEGDKVLFRRDKISKVFNVKNRNVFFEKTKFNVSALIGQPYGSMFEVENGKLIKVDPNKDLDMNASEANTGKSGTDNRNLQDSDSNQKMSKDDILKLKEDGATGEKIIEKLIENSETFKTKTEYSQAKFIKKKKKKHTLVFAALRPTPRLVMDMYSRDPGKICYLRPDSLSQILNYSNVMYGSRVAVAETCQGLLIASVLQRMGGSGKLIRLVPMGGSFTSNHALENFSFPSEQWKTMYRFHLEDLAGLEELSPTDKQPDEGKQQPLEGATQMEVEAVNGKESNGDVEMRKEPEQKEEESCTTTETESATKPHSESSTKTETESATKTDADSERLRRREEKAVRAKVARDTIVSKELDSLIIAVKYNPVPLLKQMLQFMRASRPVVIFSQYLDPLRLCYTHIKEEKLGIQVRLTESWFRHYQVLPQRTHPEINMTGTGGFLLTFMTLDPSLPSIGQVKT